MADYSPQEHDGQFIQTLSLILIGFSFLGGFIVLLDIRLTLTFWGQVIYLGKEGFSPEAKGMVLQSMLFSGFGAVISFWYGISKQGQEQAQSATRIAESVPPVVAAVLTNKTQNNNGNGQPHGDATVNGKDKS